MSMSMMNRFQRKRTKGWQMPDNTIYVGRPSKFGNPFKPGEHGTAEECKELYRQLVFNDRTLRDAIEKELMGKNVACWCKLGDPCHGDVMLDFSRPTIVRIACSVIDEQKRRVASAKLPHTWSSASFVPLRDWLTDSLENWKALPSVRPEPDMRDKVAVITFLKHTPCMDVIEAALRVENNKLTLRQLMEIIGFLGETPQFVSINEPQVTAVELRGDGLWLSDEAKAMIGNEAKPVSFGG